MSALEFGYGYGSQPMVVNYPPAYGYGGNNNGLFGGTSGDGWLGVLFLIALLNGGLNGFGGNAGAAMATTAMQDGFNQAALSGQLSGLSTAVTNGFATAEIANCNRNTDAIIANYTSQIANMNENFNNVRSIDTRLDAIAAEQARCCCENKSAINDVKYTIATEAAATRAASAANVQTVLDKLCQLELDNLKSQLEQSRADNVALRSQLSTAAQTRAIEDYIRPPINPSYSVPNPYACYNNSTACGVCAMA